MQIQIGVNQKMKLYNVYRICKQNLEYFQSPNLIQQQTEGKEIVFRMENWTEFKERLKNLRKLSILKDYIDNNYVIEKKKPIKEIADEKININYKVIIFVGLSMIGFKALVIPKKKKRR